MVLFGSRRRAEDLEVEVARLQAWLAELGAMDDTSPSSASTTRR